MVKQLTPRKIQLFSVMLGILVILGLFSRIPNAAHPFQKTHYSRSGVSVSGWIYPDCPDAIPTLKSVEPAGIHIEWLKVAEEGRIQVIEYDDASCNGFSEENLAKVKETTPNVLVTVSGRIDSQEEGASKLLFDQAKQDVAINEITAFVKDKELHGAEIDFEPMAFMSNEMRDAYFSFLGKLHEHLATEGKILVIDTPAEHPNELHYYNWRYAEVAKVADQIVIMAYDRHFDHPGPVTPDDWLTDVVKFAQTEIPAGKLIIGLPNYGYLAEGKQMSNLGTTQRLDWLSRHPAEGKPIRDPNSQELVVKTDGFTLWYSDQKTIDHKIDLVKKLGITQVSIWYVGDQNPWPTK